MHMVQDENGQMVHHGHDACQQPDHQCTGCASAGECGGHDPKKEAVALVKYMLQHNQQHAAELERVAANLDKLGMGDVAEQLRAAVSEFQKGNLRLSLASALAAAYVKEV